jgi:hypothetical protein
MPSILTPPWKRFLVESITAQLIKEFGALYGPQAFSILCSSRQLACVTVFIVYGHNLCYPTTPYGGI